MQYEKVIPTKSYPFKIFTFKSDSPDRLVPPHWHESAELLYCLNGKLEISFDHYQYTLESKTAIFINSNRIHSSRCPIPGQVMAVQFPLHFLKKLTEEKYGKTILFELVPRNTTSQIVELLEKVYEYFKYDETYQKLKLMSSIYELFSILLESCSKDIFKIQDVPTVKHLEFLEEVNNYIRENFQYPLLLEDLAEKFNYNPSYFSRMYKKYMGINFLEYLNSIRLDFAYQKLQQTDQSILDIAMLSGFSNSRTFYNVFKKNYGMSPQNYRKKYFINR